MDSKTFFFMRKFKEAVARKRKRSWHVKSNNNNILQQNTITRRWPRPNGPYLIHYYPSKWYSYSISLILCACVRFFPSCSYAFGTYKYNSERMASYGVSWVLHVCSILQYEYNIKYLRRVCTLYVKMDMEQKDYSAFFSFSDAFFCPFGLFGLIKNDAWYNKGKKVSSKYGKMFPSWFYASCP